MKKLLKRILKFYLQLYNKTHIQSGAVILQFEVFTFLMHAVTFLLNLMALILNWNCLNLPL